MLLLLGSALAFGDTAVAAQNLPPGTTSLGLLAAPVIRIIASAAIVGEAPSLSLGIAIAMVIGGNALSTLAPDRVNQRD